jgi:crossover junction endodeoxyribonuclease RusA
VSTSLIAPWVGLCTWCGVPINGVLELGGDDRAAEPCGHALPALGALEYWRFPLPYPLYPEYPALQANLRGDRWSTNRDVQAVRGDVSRICRGIKPGAKHLTVHLCWRPRRYNGQDDDNLWPLMKACCDALARGGRRPTLKNRGMSIGLDLVPGDTRRHMTKMPPSVLETGPAGMWLTVAVTR